MSEICFWGRFLALLYIFDSWFKWIMHSKEFTFVEILLVINILIIITAFIFLVGLKFFQTKTLDDVISDIAGILRRAQS